MIIKGKIYWISYHKETFILIQKNNNNATILEYIEQKEEKGKIYDAKSALCAIYTQKLNPINKK